MLLSVLSLAVGLPVLPVVLTLPTHSSVPTRRLLEPISPLDSVLLFDSPAFQDPANPANLIASVQSFVFLRQIDPTPIISKLSSVLESTFGLDIGDKISTVEQRIRLFGAVGLGGKEVTVDVGGCDTEATLDETPWLPDPGMVLRNVSLGACKNAKELTGQVKLTQLDDREISATIFPTPPDGFGIISDIDDTIKISNVLDKLKLVQSTFLDDPKPVAGMPELYASLAGSLNSPQFIYISGSPFQLYPFLHDFISTTYSVSKGPILLQNLTLVDIPSLINFASSDGVQEYKVSMIDLIHGMYPKKRFIAIGDSTQKDPETYGEVFRKYGEFIACSWIRRVDGANNTAERFAEAFQGVPTDKFRIFSDADIPGLANVDIAGGKC